jgi:hypothetical protein
MAKDAGGHGSESGGGSGAHSAKIQATPQLQRRHFEAIAADLKGASDAGSPAHAQRVSDMADKLSTTNPGFNRNFFTAAATPGGAYNNKYQPHSRAPGGKAGRVADVQRKVSMFKASGVHKPDPAAGFERFK